MKKQKEPTPTESALIAQSVALIAAEEFALSMVPLLIAVNEAGGVAKAIKILNEAPR